MLLSHAKEAGTRASALAITTAASAVASMCDFGITSPGRLNSNLANLQRAPGSDDIQSTRARFQDLFRRSIRDCRAWRAAGVFSGGRQRQYSEAESRARRARFSKRQNRAGGHCAEIPSNSIRKWAPGQGVSTFMQPSGYKGSAPFTGPESGSNGMTLDERGRL